MRANSQVVTAEERALIIKVARCELIVRAQRENAHDCHAVVGSQAGTGEGDRQVPEAWAGNLQSSGLVFLSSNPSISEPGPGQPLNSAEDYPRVSSTDNAIVEFQGRRFDRPYLHPSSGTVAFYNGTGSIPTVQSSFGPRYNAEPKNCSDRRQIQT